jgi:hypothetical protein
MAHHILAQSRTQTTLFPEVLEDFVTEDNSVRVVDVFVEGLDLIKNIKKNIKKTPILSNIKKTPILSC